jgi:hypothetical protein
VNLHLALLAHKTKGHRKSVVWGDGMIDSATHEQIRWKIYERTAEVDAGVWSSLHPESGSFLCLDYLRAIEDAHDEGLEVRLAVFYLHEKTIGIAAFQIAHFITSDDAYSNVVLSFLNSVLRKFRGKHVHNILINGNAFATGEHGFSFLGDCAPQTIAFCLHGAMEGISKMEQGKGRRICAMVTKDFYPNTIPVAQGLEKYRFKRFQVDHNMVMPIHQSWKSFDDYLDSLNTKFRTKAKSSMKRSSTIEIIRANADDVIAYADALQALYENVYNKADFRLGKLDLKTLANLLRRIPQQFFVQIYLQEGVPVGFMSAMRCGKVLEAHVIGIDYDKNRDHGVYQRMLYDYVSLAIELGCNRVVYGRTAAEIKSTVGAFPVDLTCCIMHRRSISNALLSMILQYVKPSEYPQRQPFKAEVLSELTQQPLYNIKAHAAEK